MSGNVGKMNDPDASLFIQVSEITGSTQRGAIVDLVKDLKSNNLWSKMKAIYPFVGGTAATHKWNLKDPRDVDAAYRLTFFGGWTHSSTGADPNGTTGYADTNLSSDPVLTLNSTHRSVYLRENTDELKIDIGESNTVGINDASFVIARSSNIFYGRTHANSNTQVENTDSRGFFISYRTDSTNQKIRKNDGVVTTSTISTSARTTRKVFIGATSDPNGAAYYSSRQVAFATIGDGLTDAEASSLYTIVQKYQTTLGRQV
jgi:hypothetical protein